MKNKILLIIFSTLFFISCHKDQNNDLYWGEASAVKNGIIWSSKPYSAFERDKWGTEYIDVIIRHFDNDYISEGLTFLKIPMEIGSYKLEPFNLAGSYTGVGATYNTFLDDGHILGDEYTLDTISLANKVDVLSFNKSDGKIELNFSANFLISQRRTSTSLDTVRFESGYVLTRSAN